MAKCIICGELTERELYCDNCTENVRSELTRINVKELGIQNMIKERLSDDELLTLFQKECSECGKKLYYTHSIIENVLCNNCIIKNIKTGVL